MAAITAAVGGAVSIGAGLVSANQAEKAGRRARAAARRKEAEILALENNRQIIPNPYANFRDISSLAKDLSGQMTNPFANLGVATKAAEFQAEQTDMALANTLDTLRATGAGSGGATALAQAALESKQGVSANLEQQEAANEKLKAEGQLALQNAKLQEKMRIQNVQMSEAQRMQAAEAEGTKFQFGAQEDRDIAKLNRLAGQEAQQLQNAAQAQSNEAAAWGGAMSAVGSIASGAMSAIGPSTTAIPSDRKLKKNIIKIGISPTGLNVYSFEYRNKKFGKGNFQGVMSDEVPKKAIVYHKDGYDMVDYSLIDVEFKQV